MTRSVWKLDGTTAQFDDGRLRARVDLLQPHLGLHALSCSERTLGADGISNIDTSNSGISNSGGVLGVDLGKVADDDLSLPETYSRVDDLVATYLQTESRPFRVQAYWRRVEMAARAGGGNVTAIELQVSINTSLLDTHPSVAVTTRIAGRLAQAGVDGRRYRMVDTAAGFSYFEAVHPSDERRTPNEPVADGAVSEARGATHVLFGDFLEKGVIVRARIRGAFLPAGATVADCDALYDAFVSEPLPLTT